MNRNRAKEIYDNIIENGINSIEDYITTRKSEELFLDFKRSADNGKSESLHANDRKNLAKAISGFGNSEGGVIVWGVDCSKDFDAADVAKATVPIENVDRFVSLLQNVITGCTLPPHNGVEHHGIKIKNQKKGYVITVIPKSQNAPHQSIIDYKYYMRAGSSFSSVTHSILSGMFGQRPQPSILLRTIIGSANKTMTHSDGKKLQGLHCQIGLLLVNSGQGIARDTFLNAEIHNLPGQDCEAWFEILDKKNWEANFAFAHKLGMICNENLRIQPRGFVQPVILHVNLRPPFNEDIKIALECGCDNAEFISSVLHNSPDNVLECYNEIIDSDLANSQELIIKLLGFKDTDEEAKEM